MSQERSIQRIMRIVLNKTYDIDRDFSMLGKTRKELLALDLNKKELIAFIKAESIPPIDWIIIIDIIFHKENINSMRYLYIDNYKAIVFKDRVYIFDSSAYCIFTKLELNSGVPNEGVLLEINERSNISYDNKKVVITFDGTVLSFSLYTYSKMLERILTEP